MLLQWCMLEPSGPGNLAAIRFSSPVRVQSIRIFPTNAQPFAQQPGIVARTEPEAFFLDLYFNAHPISSPKSKEKPKATNALVPTVIAYAGGQVDVAVGMGPEVATRLMIVRGNFQFVSMAIYGDVVSEMPSPSLVYELKPLPSVEPIAIAPALDPANSRDPTNLARQLLRLIPDAPELPLVIRLMFCLKPSSEDWDLPEFPYLHPDLDEEAADFDLEKAYNLTSKPVPDYASHEQLRQFAERVARLTQAKDASQPYSIAGILCHIASQHPVMARCLLEVLDFERIFDATSLARRFNSESFLNLVTFVSKDMNTDSDTRSVATKVIARIRGWSTLEDALSNTQGDFIAAASTLRDIGTDEQSFGIWLESMVIHEDIVSTMEENPVPPISLLHPPLLLRSPKTAVSHDEFVAFLRAFIGVSCVLAVYAWADSLPHERCRERTLGIIRLWQGVDGYREIVDHLMLLRQMTFRLGCMTDNDPPTRAGIDTEHILVNLARDPQAILRPNFIKCILELGLSTSFITDEQRLSMRQAAIVADDGLPGAIDELSRPLERPPSMASLRTLRVALAVVFQELDEQGERHVLEDFWQDGSRSLVTCLVDVLLAITDEIRGHFALLPPPSTSHELMNQHFRSSQEILRLLLRLIPDYPLPSRVLRTLTTSVADLFVCTDAVDLLYSQSSPACVAAQETRQSCIDIIRLVCEPASTPEGGKVGGEVVLGTLLEHGLRSEDRDPIHHLLQVFCLIDYLLPMQDAEEEQQSLWVQRIIPTLLRQLLAFCRALDTENKVHFVKRLINLDRGIVGVGDWLLVQELKVLSHAVQSLLDPTLSLQQRIITQYQITLSLRFLCDLADSSSSSHRWFIDSIAAADDASRVLVTCLTSLLDQHMLSPNLTAITRILASEYSNFHSDLRFALVLVLWRSLRNPEGLFVASDKWLELSITVLSTIPPIAIDSDRIGQEIAIALVSLLEWLVVTSHSGLPQLTTIHGITPTSFGTCCDNLRKALQPEWIQRLEDAVGKLSVAEDVLSVVPSTTLPESIELSIHDVEELLRSTIPPPSTPPRKALNQDVLGLVTISPPALIRSPASTGLTKTYLNNDFRQLRQISARANTSRLPSMHVDEFESASSPTLLPLSLSQATANTPFAAEAFPPLAPPFNPL
ncbi:hypothetical protein A0H81_09740 [Grifola frondosa]|uniref:Virilizer N-terminal domain-containing protein n=1 Tax=Grifola frondosa TaxID=5627 RepID=A0A1C7M259_GRIFR|nr:hypothetical protein A0H81_09740 [Grifola frondosa]